MGKLWTVFEVATVLIDDMHLEDNCYWRFYCQGPGGSPRDLLGPPVPFSLPDSRDLLEVLVRTSRKPLSTFTK